MSTPPRLEIQSSPGLAEWMHTHALALAFTTYQIGKLFLVGSPGDGRLSFFERTFNRAMGLWSDGETLLMSSLFQIWRFENMLRPDQVHQGYDRLYVPRIGYTTGDLDIHDLGLDARGRVVFANTLFNCLSTLDGRHSFVPLWTPPWISRLVPEDRCHLNGFAMVDGEPGYATVVARSDVSDGWREHRRAGGCVVDVRTNDVVATGLAMPHSPRVHDGRLWLLEAGSGRFGAVDLARGTFDPIAFCPGFLRGLAFVGPYAILGTSRHRENRTFEGLPLEDELRARGMQATCGLQVVDTRTGDVLHWLRLEGLVAELYDVAVLPGCRRPMALGFVSDEIQKILHVGPGG